MTGDPLNPGSIRLSTPKSTFLSVKNHYFIAAKRHLIPNDITIENRYLNDIVDAIFNDVEVVTVVTLGNDFLIWLDWILKHCI